MEAVWSPVESEWVLPAPHRGGLDAWSDRTEAQGEVQCTFCPGGAEAASLVNGPILVPSKYPLTPPTSAGEPSHLVLLYSNDHDVRTATADKDAVARVLAKLAEGTTILQARPPACVYAFEVVGAHFGPTVPHPHWQILKLPFTPNKAVLNAASCVLCTAAGAGPLVSQGQLVRADVPAWARLPYEVVVYPRRHVGSLQAVTPEEISELAASLTRIFHSHRDQVGSELQYLISLMQPPPSAVTGHLRIELVPLHKAGGALKRPGGLEIGAGIYVNPVAVDAAAEDLRSRLPVGRPQEA